MTERVRRGDGPPIVSDATLLADLARRLDRLRPSHRDPEQFHVEKSEIAAELRRLARAADLVHRGAGRGVAG